MSKSKARFVYVPGVGNVPKKDFDEVKAQVKDVMVSFGNLLDHFLGIKELSPNDKVRKIFQSRRNRR
jgi:hypothetical protein